MKLLYKFSKNVTLQKRLTFLAIEGHPVNEGAEIAKQAKSDTEKAKEQIIKDIRAADLSLDSKNAMSTAKDAINLIAQSASAKMAKSDEDMVKNLKYIEEVAKIRDDAKKDIDSKEGLYNNIDKFVGTRTETAAVLIKNRDVLASLKGGTTAEDIKVLEAFHLTQDQLNAKKTELTSISPLDSASQDEVARLVAEIDAQTKVIDAKIQLIRFDVNKQIDYYKQAIVSPTEKLAKNITPNLDDIHALNQAGTSMDILIKTLGNDPSIQDLTSKAIEERTVIQKTLDQCQQKFEATSPAFVKERALLVTLEKRAQEAQSNLEAVRAKGATGTELHEAIGWANGSKKAYEDQNQKIIAMAKEVDSKIPRPAPKVGNSDNGLTS